jgi:DNA-binding transcriptional regulator YbjK
VTAQKLLRRITAHKRNVVEALAAGDQRLAQAEDRLRRRVTAAALLHRDTVEQLADPEPARQLSHEYEPSVRRQPLRRGRDLDHRRPLC